MLNTYVARAIKQTAYLKPKWLENNSTSGLLKELNLIRYIHFRGKSQYKMVEAGEHVQNPSDSKAPQEKHKPPKLKYPSRKLKVNMVDS
jgi:hypothetical protein